MAESKHPVEKEWITKAGYLALVGVHDILAHRCGYVRIDRAHPLYRMPYDSQYLYGIRVHGGLTYSRNHTVCVLTKYLRYDKEWWFGYDCSHYYDSPDPKLINENNRMYINSVNNSGSSVKSLEFCINQCEKLAKQLKQYENLDYWIKECL